MASTLSSARADRRSDRTLSVAGLVSWVRSVPPRTPSLRLQRHLAALYCNTRSTCRCISVCSHSTNKQHDSRRLPRCVTRGASHAPRISGVNDDCPRHEFITLVCFSAELHEPYWRAPFPAACCLIFFYACTLRISSASWRIALGTSTLARTAFDTW